jgi:hypothetical protein
VSTVMKGWSDSFAQKSRRASVVVIGVIRML